MSYRYLHSAVISHGLMLVFGGNTHNDTSFSHGAKCFSADFYVYDIACDRWYNSQASVPRDINADMARFGHSAVLHNGTMIVHAGFNGLLKNDVLSFTPGSCEMFKEHDACLNSRAGIKCVWDSKSKICRRLSNYNPKSGKISFRFVSVYI